MAEETKTEITAVLSLLKNTLVSNNVSMAVTTDAGGKLFFFDTRKYIETGKMEGISFFIEDLVK
jgi:hypothetical protein